MDGSSVEGPDAMKTPVLRRVEAVVNAASGSVGPGAAQALEQILSDFGVSARVADARPDQLAAATRAAVDAGPDLLVVLAGDGTASLAAGLAGPEGPLIAPLPGGTMNMLPHALYGPANWRQALARALSQGVERTISGGEVGGRSFYVAAILGSPALFADAREAMRARRARLAWIRARRAVARAFSRQLRYALDGGLEEKSESLMLMCPLVSHGPVDENALEAAAMNPHHVGELLRLGVNAVMGRWRSDPSVKTTLCQSGWAAGHGRIPAVLDGEPCRLDPKASFTFKPKAFRALAPPLDHDPGESRRF